MRRDLRRWPVGGLALAALASLAVAGGDVGRPAAAQEASPSVRYVVRGDAQLARLDVEMCFDGAAPPEVGPGIDRAGGALRGARRASGEPLPIRAGRIALDGVGADACIRYELDLEEARQASRFSGRFGVDVFTSAGAFLWRDRRRPPRGGATLRFELPEGLSAATPWPLRDGAHHLDDSAFRRPSFVAMGRLRPLTVSRQRARVTAVRLGDDRFAIDEVGIRRWLETAVDGIATVQGRFPVDELLVVLVPRRGRGMGFGMVRRGGGHSVAFEVGRDSSVADLTEAWVTWHELSHLQLPALPQRDAWLYEGLATYYQEVIAARVGVKPREEAWRQLVAGFDRGARSRGRRPLSEEAAAMMRTYAFQRVYWAGTAFALEADVALRARGSSLDEAIARGAQTWRHSTRVWTSDEICALWDRPLDAAVLRPLRRTYAARVEFPRTRPVLSRLGVRATEGGVELEDEAELGALRRAIMSQPD